MAKWGKPTGTSNRSERLFKVSLEFGRGLILMANLAAGSLLFNRVFSDRPFTVSEAITGIVIVFLLYGFAFVVLRGGVKQ